MSTPDTDCNHVTLSLSDPNITIRCAMKEGHVGGGHNLRGEVMTHKHRAPVPTFTDPFGVVPLGGKHRRTTIAEAMRAMGRADAEIRRRLALVTGGPR